MTNEDIKAVATALETYRMTKDAPVPFDSPSAWEVLEATLDTLEDPDIGRILDEVDECGADPREEPDDPCFSQGYDSLCELIDYDPEIDNLEDL